jgi:D-alanyl-lipoteichoic acid acyltransferase DltB (MBOAT superfamily)
MVPSLFQNGVLAADAYLVIPVLVSFAAAFLVQLLPQLRSRYGLSLICILASASTYRRAALGYLLMSAALYVFLWAFSWSAKYSLLKRLGRWRCSCVAMIGLLVLFLAGRYYQLEARSSSFLGVGVFLFSLNMWAFLRLVTLLWEFGSERIGTPSLLPYVIWICLPFTLIGPIFRYSQFQDQLPIAGRASTREKGRFIITMSWWKDLIVAFGKLSLGLLLGAFQVSLSSQNSMPKWEKVVIAFSLAPWSFYFLRAGYFKLMESFARFWGISLPPSFNRPFGRRNLSEFWANWNMTATSVFRDYFFYNRWGLTKVNIYLNTLIVFLMVGIWHGLNGYWMLWGLLHGIGFCAFLGYRRHQSHLSEWKAKLAGPWVRWAAPSATYVYVCSCWFLPPTLLKLLR